MKLAVQSFQIYVLLDDRKRDENGKLGLDAAFYIGYCDSTNGRTLQDKLHEHLFNAKQCYGIRPKVEEHIRRIDADLGQVLIKRIEWTTAQDYREREAHWINELESLGCVLMNVMKKGGCGLTSKTAKIVSERRWKDPEERRKHSERMTAAMNTPEKLAARKAIEQLDAKIQANAGRCTAAIARKIKRQLKRLEQSGVFRVYGAKLTNFRQLALKYSVNWHIVRDIFQEKSWKDIQV